MIFLFLNEHIRGAVSNEETFWSVLSENIPGAEGIALKSFNGDIEEYIQTKTPDIIIFNSILGDIKTPTETKKIVLLQDNFAAMRKLLPFDLRRITKWFLNFGCDDYLVKERMQREALANADVVVAVSKNVADSYGVSNAKIIPIGTDIKLFHPFENKGGLKERYGIPQEKKIKIFVGSAHSVKGFDILKKEIVKDVESFYILVLKDKRIPSLGYSNVKIFQRVSQEVLAELYNCADVFVGRSRVETLWLVPIEAMFCGVPVDVTPVGIFVDWKPANKNPRAEAFEAGLDRETMIIRWKNLIASL